MQGKYIDSIMRRFFFFFVFFLLETVCFAQNRSELMLRHWQFSHDAESWKPVEVPHDWAISGPFDKKWDLQKVAIEQNGETEATEKSGRSGALPWIGKGFYKTTFSVPADFKGHAELLFDGAMSEPVVYVNGKEAGRWAYGYNAFRVDATPYIHQGENTLEVHLQNLEESSRWYPGAGLYRPVTLVTTSKTHLDDWSLVVRATDMKKKDLLTVDVDGKVLNVPPKTKPNVVTMAKVTITTPDGETVNGDDLPLAADGSFHARFYIRNPKLWSPETPYLYTVTAKVNRVDWNGSEEVYDGQSYELLDSKTFKTGLRTVSVSKDGGFQLNGQTRKLKGVCLHHDLGPLGAAINKAALIRQIKTMKEMGCDAIRTAHNMPSQWQMDICDSLGMMVMAESFDMWLYPKCKNGYARFFREWADRDITNLVLANRNHPCIVMWSIGNEIPEQWSKEGTEIAAHLQNLCHRLDPTRPVTQGMDKAEGALSSGFAQVMDVPGFNYRVHKYNNNIALLPHGFLLGSETASTVSSRGVYKFPVVIDDNSKFSSWAKGYDPNAIKNADGQCSGYDVEYCPWSNLPDDDWRWQDDRKWVIGEFVWTGYDYLGEPSPYDEYWPSRSSYFGICDLAGLPKDRYWLYRSKWNTSDHTIHLLPHWTWPGREGEVTPVYCYTDYPEAELFVNGKSQGRIRKQADAPDFNPVKHEANPNRLDRYRLRWNNVVYEPGMLKVVVYDENGEKAGEQVVRTAGKPSRIRLESDRTSLTADGDDLAYVTISLVDKQGTELPDATDQLEFEVTGAGKFRGVCNGDATSLESFTEPRMKLFSGKLVVTVQASDKPGTLRLLVKDKTRKQLKATITIPVR